MPGSSVPSGQVRRAVEDAHRREWARVLASTVRVAGDLDLAEECVQEAYLSALSAWQRDGVPAAPGAWLTTTARRRALDVHRRDRTLRRKLPLLVVEEASTDTGDDDGAGATPLERGDDRLRLMFICCHPALPPETQIALTLRLVCGLTTAEVAAACLVPEATMAARVTRAKKKIAAARIPFRIPSPDELPERLDVVLTVILLVLSTGHAAPSGPALVRADLVARALDLSRMLVSLLPQEREVRALLALALLTEARRPARTSRDGELVLLADQDRSLWDAAMVQEGCALAAAALAPHPGRFALQAAIAAVHAEAVTAADTDWAQVLALYDELARVWPSPVVGLNRAVATAEVHGPAQGLAEIDVLSTDGRLASYRYLHAARAELLLRLGREAEAGAAYERALLHTANEAERRFLAGRLAGLSGLDR